MPKGRFTVKSATTGFARGVSIIIDRKTRVQYLFHRDGYGGGMTVLVDRDGKPLLADFDE